jgi:hypothetical protein
MSDSYVASKVREALVTAQGSRGRAQRLLLSWIMEDELLLRGLARPFLKAITMSALERVARTMPAPTQTRRPPQPAAPRSLPPEALDSVLAQLGRQLADDREGEAAAPPRRRGPDHAATIRALAAGFARKKGW